MIKLFRHPSVNFGDYLSLWIAELLNIEVEEVGEGCKEPHYCFSGSILNHCNKFTTVWGAGIANEDDYIPKCDFISVRGVLTQQILLKKGYKCEHVGDPALILPKLYHPEIKKKYNLGMVPHYVDYYKAMDCYRENNINIIDVLKHPANIIDNILECDMIISSSLHGLITAHAYGIPAMWVEFTDDIIGDGFKYRDYFSSVSIHPYEPLDLREIKEIDYINDHIPVNLPKYDIDKLFSTCPII